MGIISNFKKSDRYKKLSRHPLWRTETFLISGAIALSLLSSGLKKAHENSKITKLMNMNKTVSIAVARTDINRNSILDKRNLVFKKYLVPNITDNMVPASHVERILNKRTGAELKAGDPILLTNLIGGDRNAMAFKIPVGKRFFTLAVKDKVVSNGWVKPNDHVDLLATINLPNRGETTFTILQDITLVTVGKSSAWSKKEKQMSSEIGFFVTPKEFELLQFAQKKGDFSVALRNPEDIRLSNSGNDDKQGVDMQKFLDNRIIRSASGGGDLKISFDDEKKSNNSRTHRKHN